MIRDLIEETFGNATTWDPERPPVLFEGHYYGFTKTRLLWGARLVHLKKLCCRAHRKEPK